MDKIVSGHSPSLHCGEEPSYHHRLELKVIIKTFSSKELNIADFDLIRAHLNKLIDEPSLLFVKKNDKVSRKILDTYKYKYNLVTSKEILSFSNRSTLVIYIFKSPFFKSKKILEIICNKIFQYSILLI